MYNLLYALAAGIAVTAAVTLFGFAVWAGIIPGFITFAALYITLARRTSGKVQKLLEEAQKELQVQPVNQRDQKARVEKAIKILESGLAYRRRQFLLAPELHAQIAMIKYATKDLDGAQVHFAQANPRNYMAKAMQAALYYQRKDYESMRAAFDAATKAGKKEAIVFAAYAWCLQQLKDNDGAQKVLARGVESNPSDEKLKAALTAIQNGKKLKMKAFEPMWWQFGLENPPLPNAGGRQVRWERR